MAGWRELFAGAGALRALVLVGGVALHAIDLYVATTILPSVVAEIGGLERYAWSTTLFVVASIVASALSARLLARLGARRAYVAASIVFGAGAWISASATSMDAMLAGRVVQGLGGGLLVALPYGMIRTLYDERLWPRAMALVSGMWGVATLVGPAIGGVLAELGAWRAAFGSLVPATALFVVLALRALPGRNETSVAPPIAWAQLALLAASVLALSGASVARSSAPLVALAVALVIALFVVERRASSRVFPRLVAPLVKLYAVLSLLAITVTSTEIFAPLFLQVLHGRSPLVAGALAALMAGGWTLGSLVGSSARDPRTIERALRVAPGIVLVATLACAWLVPARADDGALVLPIAAALATLGVGVGIAWPHVLTRVLQVAPADEPELASASITTVQLFATALGAALAGVIANGAGLATPDGVSRAALALFATFSLAPAACLALYSTTGSFRTARAS
ncbi:MFS transporter [Sandaracinus amylolyticus]|uniref:Multidrug resistance protein B n=1 Tax=Sandaracinus amylolyticus TaxID=927083 RepID=A0A0F6YKS4_9BACT|nr:MFS transporter [Sandaracinus amylolyticus]AKF09516.1 Multidrug resistance protein B [Sandaracinus amylolyticus]